MAISSATSRNDYTGNGAVDTYAYTFKIFLESDLVVKVRDTDGAETTLTLTTHYTVTGEGNEGGGNVALVNGSFAWLDGDGDLKTGYTLSILRRRPLTQTADFRNQGEFYGSTHEDTFDHLVMIDQQQQDQLDRCFRLPDTIDPDDFSAELPGDLADSPGYILGINDDGDGLTLIQVPDLDSVIDLDLGSSGNPGSLDIFPATAARGRLRFTAANSVGDTVTGIVNASQAAARTYTIPDAGGDASFVMTLGAQTITGAKTFADQTLKLQETGGTDVITINVASLGAARAYTLPDAGGAASFMMTAGTNTMTGVIVAGNSGTVGAPSYAFDANTGFYSDAGDEIKIAINGSANFVITAQFKGPNGSASAPTWSFNNEADCGMYVNGTNNIGFATAGTLRWQITEDGSFAVNGSAAAGVQMLANDGAVTTPGYSFNASGATSSGMFWNSSLAFALATGIDMNIYYNSAQFFNISPSSNSIVCYATTKTVDLGLSSQAFDDIYADDFQNVADIEMLDWKKDMKTGKVETLNDLAIIKAIQPKKDKDGNVVFNAKGHAFWDDDTLPEWMFTEDKRNPGNLVRDAEGRPWVSLRMLSALSLGAIGQLITRVEELEKKVAA